MKYIIKENEQIIRVRGRHFYYPPKDQWIEDKYLPLWTDEKLLRLGIYKLKETPYDTEYYKKDGSYTDSIEGVTLTRTYGVEPRGNTVFFGEKKLKQYKREGIRKYASIVALEPLLEFTSDSFDLPTYKQTLKDAYLAAKAELTAIGTDNNLSAYEKFEAFKAHNITWPDMPLSDEEMQDYGI